MGCVWVSDWLILKAGSVKFFVLFQRDTLELWWIPKISLPKFSYVRRISFLKCTGHCPWQVATVFSAFNSVLCCVCIGKASHKRISSMIVCRAFFLQELSVSAPPPPPFSFSFRAVPSLSYWLSRYDAWFWHQVPLENHSARATHPHWCLPSTPVVPPDMEAHTTIVAISHYVTSPPWVPF